MHGGRPYARAAQGTIEIGIEHLDRPPSAG
jgi:hypothetical protein